MAKFDQLVDQLTSEATDTDDMITPVPGGWKVVGRLDIYGSRNEAQRAAYAIQVRRDQRERPRPTLRGSGRINPKWSKAWDRGENV
jgi:hypothetical protein